MVGKEAVTIREAAARLDVTPQRVSQMLSDGVLEGPPQRVGGRARANAARVYVSSLAARQAQTHGEDAAK